MLKMAWCFLYLGEYMLNIKPICMDYMYYDDYVHCVNYVGYVYSGVLVSYTTIPKPTYYINYNDYKRISLCVIYRDYSD